LRVIICGDTHIGAILGLGKPNGNGGNSRIDDYEASLNYIIDYAIEVKADVFAQTGDVFDVRNPEAEHVAVINRCIKRLSVAGIPSIWLMGNHDYKKSGESFTSAIASISAKDYPNTRIILNPSVVEIADGKGDKISLILMPYRDRRMYEGKTTEEDSFLCELEVEKLIKDCDDKYPIITIGHNFFFEGSYSHYGGAEVLIRHEIFKKCDLVTMGHYHHFRILNKKDPIVFYIGSMDRLNFGDANVDKYFVDYNTQTKKVNVKTVPSRPLIDSYLILEDADFNNLNSMIVEKIDSLIVKDAVVRVKLAIKDTLVASVKKSDISKQLYNNGAFYVSKILLDPISKKINRDIEILQEKTDISMFEAFLKKQEFPKEMTEDILRQAKILMK